ncbi:MAG: sugar phosphate isomerase/epimerase [Phycisphaerales bacterium]|nr:sugar phosphate isomerase/epimerase [Phycisphaerales bacterium]MCB9840839.1 sugar phosphate isomerase/epimerase [Phycisphaeraceae bacterium]
MHTPLAVSLAGLRRDVPDAPWSTGPRAALAWVASIGVRQVQLDAAAPGMRPRELDRSGRRDVAALLRRHELGLTGLDLWIPGEHLSDPVHLDRAVGAIDASIGLAADLSPLVGGGGRLVSLTLPDGVAADVVGHIAASADRVGVRVADHAWPARGERAGEETTDGSVDAPARVCSPSIGIGLDPAAVVLAGQSVAKATARVADRLLTARLCDLSSAGRVLPGEGRLDVVAYRACLSLTPGGTPVVIDVRGLEDQDAAARRMVRAWDAAGLAS